MNKQICKSAIALISNLLFAANAFSQVDGSQAIAAVNMGPVINTAARDAEPTFSADGQTMYFNCIDRQSRTGSDICVTNREGDGWSEPQIVEAVSTAEYLEVEPLLSPDGQQLYISSDRPGGEGGHDIWVSSLENGQWSEPVNMGAPINSPEMDHCIYFTGANWETAFWTSTRPGGFGRDDIWTSTRVNGVWQEAVNLGANINSAVTEHHSLPSRDGKSLYVTTTRDDGYGNQDIFVSTKDSQGNWGPLSNLGPLVNTAENDRCPAFSPDYATFYFDSQRAGGYGSLDIWYLPYAAIEHIK